MLPPYTNRNFFWSRLGQLITVNPAQAQIGDALGIADAVNNSPARRSPVASMRSSTGASATSAVSGWTGWTSPPRYDRATGFGSIDFVHRRQLRAEPQVSPLPGAAIHLISYAANVSRFKLRASAGARIGRLRAQATLNHSAGYRLDPPVGMAPQQSRVGAFDVVNLFLSYEFRRLGRARRTWRSPSTSIICSTRIRPNTGETQIDPQFSGFTNGQ